MATETTPRYEHHLYDVRFERSIRKDSSEMAYSCEKSRAAAPHTSRTEEQNDKYAPLIMPDSCPSSAETIFLNAVHSIHKDSARRTLDRLLCQDFHALCANPAA